MLGFNVTNYLNILTYLTSSTNPSIINYVPILDAKLKCLVMITLNALKHLNMTTSFMFCPNMYNVYIWGKTMSMSSF